jgi:pimeloyl-ACP methyl ester carboxylesterase
VVLFLPALADSWRSYERVLDELPLSIRAIAVSPRGHGDSDKPATGYRVEDLAHVWKKMLAGLLDFDDTDELSRTTTPTLLEWG